MQETKINGGSEPKNLAPGYIEIWNCCTVQKGYAGTAYVLLHLPYDHLVGCCVH